MSYNISRRIVAGLCGVAFGLLIIIAYNTLRPNPEAYDAPFTIDPVTGSKIWDLENLTCKCACGEKCACLEHEQSCKEENCIKRILKDQSNDSTNLQTLVFQ